jgi:CHAT domain-containing protein
LSDEYISLPSGFLFAGSPNIVTTLWAVNDFSTALLMIRLYQNIQQKQPPTLALKNAQIWLKNLTKEELKQWTDNLQLNILEKEELLDYFDQIEDGTKPFTSPYYWAGFCVIGKVKL